MNHVLDHLAGQCRLRAQQPGAATDQQREHHRRCQREATRRGFAGFRKLAETVQWQFERGFEPALHRQGFIAELTAGGAGGHVLGPLGGQRLRIPANGEARVFAVHGAVHS